MPLRLPRPLQLNLFGPAPGKTGGAPPAETVAALAPTQIDLKIPLATVSRLRQSPSDFASALDGLLDVALRQLTLTDNRARILSFRPVPGTGGKGEEITLRLHWSFLGASPEVLQAIADFVQTRSRKDRGRALEVLRQHFSRHRESQPAAAARRRKPRLAPHGEVHDLEEIRDEINERYFEGRLEVPITWSRPGAKQRRKRRSIHLGTYNSQLHLVRIHPALDQRLVPRYAVASVVHHELLHADMPAETVRGRRRLHPPEFRARERHFEDFARAETWLRENLDRLLGWSG